jgi:hypothetical protein
MQERFMTHGRATRLARRLATLVVSAALFAGAAPIASGQQTPPAEPDRLRIFLDCSGCDAEYVRREVGFVDYVRDRTDADLHVLVTYQSTGSGGRAWTMEIIGLGRFTDHDHTYEFTTEQNASTDDRRREFTRVFKLALVDYTAGTPTLDELDVTWRAPVAAAAAEPQHDPWNYWVFRTSASGSANGEQASGSASYRFSFSANRVTEDWKINLSANSSVSESTFEVDEDMTVISKRDSWSASGLVVRSLGPQWSVASRVSASHSSFSNTDRSITVRPGIEFDFFPYAESSRRSLTIQYNVGLSRYQYREITVFDKLEETVPYHSVGVSLGLRQPWGTLSSGASYSQHLNHTDRYSASVSGSTNVRLFRGFSFNVFGSYGKINDQISLPKGDASRDEVLLRLRQLATNYSYYFSWGLTYTFGSIFNNVVNPRFSGGGATIIIFD